MAALFRKALSLLLPVLGAVASAAGQAPADGLDVEFDTFAYDGGTSKVEFRGLRLSQGDLRLTADEGTSSSLDFEEGAWELRGDVHITVGSVRISSDEARFTSRNNELTTFDLRGQPATFEDLDPPSAEVATGGADRIFYDHTERTLSLTDNAWLRVGANDELTGCHWIYDVDAGTFMSGSNDCDQPFRIRITRPAEDADTDPPRAP